MERTYIDEESIKKLFDFCFVNLKIKDKYVSVIGVSEDCEFVTVMTLNMYNDKSIREVVYNKYHNVEYSGKLENFGVTTNRADCSSIKYSSLIGKYIDCN